MGYPDAGHCGAGDQRGVAFPLVSLPLVLHHLNCCMIDSSCPLAVINTPTTEVPRRHCRRRRTAAPGVISQRTITQLRAVGKVASSRPTEWAVSAGIHFVRMMLRFSLDRKDGRAVRPIPPYMYPSFRSVSNPPPSSLS